MEAAEAAEAAELTVLMAEPAREFAALVTEIDPAEAALVTEIAVGAGLIFGAKLALPTGIRPVARGNSPTLRLASSSLARCFSYS